MKLLNGHFRSITFINHLDRQIKAIHKFIIKIHKLIMNSPDFSSLAVRHTEQDLLNLIMENDFAHILVKKISILQNCASKGNTRLCGSNSRTDSLQSEIKC
ncbi:MAG: hypothetical protein U1C97_00500 [Candidatus Gracilibacteria bacterium]|nr:hypothetical protein [Candidatus Gracilibacteria bacterium]